MCKGIYMSTTLFYRKKWNYFDILFRKIRNIHPSIGCNQHHRHLVCNYIAPYNNHKCYYHFQLYYIHTAYNPVQTPDANIHLEMLELMKKQQIIGFYFAFTLTTVTLTSNYIFMTMTSSMISVTGSILRTIWITTTFWKWKIEIHYLEWFGHIGSVNVL